MILISNTCSSVEYKKLQSIKYAEKVSPQQNYFSMLIDGLLANNCEVICISPRSIAPNNCNVTKLSKKEEIISNKLKFIYPKAICKNPKRNINNIIQVRKIIKSLEIDENTLFIYDPLSFDASIGLLYGTKKIKAMKIALITDLPMYISMIEKNGKSRVQFLKGLIKQKIFLSIIKDATGFCFLTESMNCINTQKKPFVVIEGISSLSKKMSNDMVSIGKPIVMYAGGLYEKFGINDLVDAVIEMDDVNFELHLYGEGTSVDYIKKAASICNKIKYKGVVGVEEIKKAESEAYLLINPRPIDEEYTKYSFPSKTLEYMSSGTPVLTTKLSGIPDEYFKYVYIITESGKQGIKNALRFVLEKEKIELKEKGMCAQKFVLREKNGKIQVQKLLDMIKE